jgi:dephospho-CoA kinase
MIAITGGVCEGKSTVIEYLRDLGYDVDSTDRIAREIYQSRDIQESISELIGVPAPVPPELLRARLTDRSIRRAVNALTHPRIADAIRTLNVAALEVPLLLETCLQGDFERVWVVTCGAAEQLRRLTERLGSEDAAHDLIRTQLTSRSKIPFADALIRTNREESTVKRFVAMAASRDLR